MDSMIPPGHECVGFKCGSGECLDNSEWLCDGTKDCYDGSDEAGNCFANHGSYSPCKNSVTVSL